MVNRLRQEMGQARARYEVGRIASIDALVLENDAMTRDLAASGHCFIDLETAALYAVGAIRGLRTAALHIVTDNPTRKTIDRGNLYEASFAEQIRIALEVLIGL